VKSTNLLYFNKDHEMVRKAVGDFVKKEILPHVDEWEESGLTPLHDLFKKMGSLGYLGIRYDSQYGGEGLDYWYETVFFEEISRIPALGIPMSIMVQTSMATPAIYEFGSEYLKTTYLRPAIEGNMVGAIAVTEPDAGSDVANLKTTAVRVGKNYIINGSKTYITNGTQADFVTTLVRTGQGRGYHCFSLFVIPTNLKGFHIGKKLDKLGMRSSDTAELYFDNLKVPAINMIGEENEGFIYQMKQFQHERFSALPECYIAAETIIELTVDFIKKRFVNGKPLIAKQALRHRLVEWISEIEMLKQLTYHVVRMKMAGMDATREISMGKLVGGRLLRKVADGCLQMFGGMGFMNEMPISRYYRDVRLLSIGGGADEVMCDVIAKIQGFVFGEEKSNGQEVVRR